MRDNFAGITGSYNAQALVIATFTEDSNEVVFDSDIDLYSLGVRIGMNIIDEDIQAVSCSITGFVNSYTLSITDPYPYTTSISLVYISDSSPVPINIEDIGITNSIADYIFDFGAFEIFVNLFRVHFSHVNGILKNFKNIDPLFVIYFRGVISSCFFSSIFGQYPFHCDGYIIRDNFIECDGENISIFKVGALTLITDNYIYSSNLSTAKLLYSLAGNFQVLNNFVDRLSDLDSHSTAYENISVIGNEMKFNADEDLDFYHKDSLISQNIMHFLGNGKLHIQVGSDKNIVLGNKLSSALVDAGSTNQVGFNTSS